VKEPTRGVLVRHARAVLLEGVALRAGRAVVRPVPVAALAGLKTDKVAISRLDFPADKINNFAD